MTPRFPPPAFRSRPRRSWPRVVVGLLGLGLLTLVVHTLFGEHGYVAIRRQEQEIRRLEAEIKRLEEENRKLTTEIKALESDPRTIERVAREQLKMARPGEKVIALPEQNSPEEN